MGSKKVSTVRCSVSCTRMFVCVQFCYFVSPWVTFQNFWNNKWIKICLYCYFNIFILVHRFPNINKSSADCCAQFASSIKQIRPCSKGFQYTAIHCTNNEGGKVSQSQRLTSATTQTEVNWIAEHRKCDTTVNRAFNGQLPNFAMPYWGFHTWNWRIY